MVDDMEDAKLSVIYETFAEDKDARQWFDSIRKRATSILDLIYTDVCGPIITESNVGNKYFVSFIISHTFL